MIKGKEFNVIILGPQGSGKGTQAEFLVKKFRLHYIGTGVIFRKLARQKSALGRRINRIINIKGNLVPSDFVIKIVGQAVKNTPKNKGLLFDGYPRNLKQARALNKILVQIGRTISHVFYLPISKKTTIRRLELRRTCRQCKRIFIEGVNLKARQRVCPKCGGEIYQRDDDKPSAIAKRLEIFNKQTKPVIDYYRKKGVLILINGEPPINQVTEEVLKKIAKK
ncbi:MAG: nucleoside monophosphate kinase [Patescibacteria group bacterium]|jgi:adenylate kinase